MKKRVIIIDSDSNGLTWLAKKLHGQKIIVRIPSILLSLLDDMVPGFKI